MRRLLGFEQALLFVPSNTIPNIDATDILPSCESTWILTFMAITVLICYGKRSGRTPCFLALHQWLYVGCFRPRSSRTGFSPYSDTQPICRTVLLPGSEILIADADAEALASEYIRIGVVTAKHRNDALHVAIAILASVDVLVSWNVRDLGNKEADYNRVNIQEKHATIQILTPDTLLQRYQ